MKQLLRLAACVAAAAPAAASAGFVVNFQGASSEASGTRFEYSANLPTANRIDQPGTPGAQEAFFTIYDFVGFVPGSNAQPAGWTFSTQPIGKTPNFINPADGPQLNLTWTYTGNTPLGVGGMSGSVPLGLFSAVSTLSGFALDDYTSQATRDSNGTPLGSLGTTTVPAAVPEPSALILGGLLAGASGVVSVWRRRHRNAAPAA